MMKRFHWSKVSPRGESFHLARAKLKGKNAASPHKQDFPEVFWIEEGTALHGVNGQQVRLERGDLVFVRSTDRHSLSAEAEDGFVLVNIAFSQATLDFLRERYFASEDRWFWSVAPCPETLRLDAGHLGWLGAWVERLDAAERSLLEIEIFLLELLHQCRGSKAAQKVENSPEWLLEALRRLNDPEVLAGGTQALARIAGRTPQHVNACLKRYRGLTATDALNAARMEFAARELRTGTKKILEICFDCGFENLAHFYRMFKAAAGTTPRAYRQNHQLLVR